MSVKYTEELRPTLQCRTFPLGSFDKYKCVVICSYYEGRYMLSRYSKRTTWETQGGHIEAGETPMEAAKRELYEESGAKKVLLPITSAADLGTVPPELMGNFSIIFYNSAEDTVFKALGVE